MMRGKLFIVLVCLVTFTTSQTALQDAFAQQVRLFSGNVYSAAVADLESDVNNFIYSPLR